MSTEQWRRDGEYQDHVLEAVEREPKGYVLKHDGGLCLWIEDPGWEPKAGDTARMFGRGFGYPVRGVVIFQKSGGMPLVARYQTADEHDAETSRQIDADRAERKRKAEESREANDARIAALPAEFRARFDRFRAGNPDFWWEHQGYELFTCEEALKIATALEASHSQDVAAFAKLSLEQQKQLVPTLDDGHSGNTFGMACRLAHWYLTKRENVSLEHGALVPLTGCEAYGCTHPVDA